jgi:SAM-dependent methyltransferase
MPHLSLTIRSATRDLTENLPIPESRSRVQHWFESGFRSALLGTTQADWQLAMSAGREPRLVRHRPSVTALPDRGHDRKKTEPLGREATPWLQELGVMDASGKVRKTMADKHRQIRHYAAILQQLAGELTLPADGSFTVIDMGCGKGYLTFAAWHLLRKRFDRPIRVIGVETRRELVDLSQAAADRIGATGLEFIHGSIAEVELPQFDALIALHACNTATDQAILRGIRQQAQLIITAPCCHHELRPQILLPPPLDALRAHGFFTGHLSEWLTDGLRTLHLEWAGYRTRLIEFVSPEHTPKNLLIAGVRHSPPFAHPNRRDQIERLKQFFAIQSHALDPLLKAPGPSCS